MANTLGGLEGLVFTGGIGEHSADIRTQICERLGWLGVRLDRMANDSHRERISHQKSSVEAFVVPTNEEMTIASHCAAILQG